MTMLFTPERIRDGRYRLCDYCLNLATHSWVDGRGPKVGCPDHAAQATKGWVR